METVKMDIPKQFEKQVKELLKRLQSAENTGSVKEFKAAYDKAGDGRPYVYIYKIREELSHWSRAMVDDMIQELAKSCALELQGGDPRKLTNEQKKRSYIDKQGYLRICVTWRAK